MEICWLILRYFGYDDQLRIVDKMWDDGTISDSDLQKARSFELKKAARDHLVALFNTYMNEKSQKFDL